MAWQSIRICSHTPSSPVTGQPRPAVRRPSQKIIIFRSLWYMDSINAKPSQHSLVYIAVKDWGQYWLKQCHTVYKSAFGSNHPQTVAQKTSEFDYDFSNDAHKRTNEIANRKRRVSENCLEVYPSSRATAWKWNLANYFLICRGCLIRSYKCKNNHQTEVNCCWIYRVNYWCVLNIVTNFNPE